MEDEQDEDTEVAECYKKEAANLTSGEIRLLQAMNRSLASILDFMIPILETEDRCRLMGYFADNCLMLREIAQVIDDVWFKNEESIEDSAKADKTPDGRYYYECIDEQERYLYGDGEPYPTPIDFDALVERVREIGYPSIYKSDSTPVVLFLSDEEYAHVEKLYRHHDDIDESATVMRLIEQSMDRSKKRRIKRVSTESQSVQTAAESHTYPPPTA